MGFSSSNLSHFYLQLYLHEVTLINQDTRPLLMLRDQSSSAAPLYKTSWVVARKQLSNCLLILQKCGRMVLLQPQFTTVHLYFPLFYFTFHLPLPSGFFPYSAIKALAQVSAASGAAVWGQSATGSSVILVPPRSLPTFRFSLHS